MGSPPKQAGGGKEIKSSYVSERILQERQKTDKKLLFSLKLGTFGFFLRKGGIFHCHNGKYWAVIPQN